MWNRIDVKKTIPERMWGSLLKRGQLAEAVNSPGCVVIRTETQLISLRNGRAVPLEIEVVPLPENSELLLTVKDGDG